ncbi:zinc-dependent alcohol dehydrogenase family protein [Vibrio sp. D173a]|uniref:zinc-dependent alcohol dehydrogenase family protein n=1 Tax=Vibrio sp. D173a TaxID=2836349 RepID=UPI00255447DD|nr:zinc-dependent alcohol dehydrogenase family protein [Vibrio sp. D173a]MDK9756298.1 zinc-dependent alcohol dehydrogenase family protein [Vibrio sp. D173a]
MSLTKTNSTKTNTRVNQLSFGLPSESLVLEHVELEPLALGNVRVQIEATNINPSDRLSIQGVGQYRRTHVPPRVPGFEAVRRVVEINDPYPTEFHIGQKVLVAQSGTWQSYVDAPAENVFAVPEELENGYACQLYINALTAWVITTQVAKLGKEDVVLINAGNSAIGKIFAQLSHSLGFTLIVITSAPERYPYDSIAVLNSKQDLQSQIDARKLPQSNVAFDAIGGKFGTELIQVLLSSGTYINYGTLSLTPYEPAFFACMKQHNIDFSTFFLRYWEESVGKSVRKKVFVEMLEHFMEHQIQLDVDCYFPLEQFQRAFELIEDESVTLQGKIILTMQ